MESLAHHLKVRLEDCWEAFDWKGNKDSSIAKAVQNVVRGQKTKADKKPYNPGFVRRTWEALNDLNRNGNPRLVELLESRQGGEELHQLLFRQDVVTLTGRVRGKVSYTQSKNTPFQSLASDGAKLAIWELLYHSYRVVGFVHDELLLELPDQGGYVDLTVCEEVKRIVCAAMAQVTGRVPVNAEYTVNRCWSKEAQLIIKDHKVYPWEPDEPAAAELPADSPGAPTAEQPQANGNGQKDADPPVPIKEGSQPEAENTRFIVTTASPTERADNPPAVPAVEPPLVEVPALLARTRLVQMQPPEQAAQAASTS
jgi:hypothetical protein